MKQIKCEECKKEKATALWKTKNVCKRCYNKLRYRAKYKQNGSDGRNLCPYCKKNLKMFYANRCMGCYRKYRKELKNEK